MAITWDTLTVNFEALDRKELVEDWRWRLDDEKLPILITCFGDLFLQDVDGSVWFLRVDDAHLSKIADSYADFQQLLQDRKLQNEWFNIGLVHQLLTDDVTLDKHQVYSFEILPVLGGAFSAENIKPCDLSVHLSICAQINEQIKDLPNGSSISINVVD